MSCGWGFAAKSAANLVVKQVLAVVSCNLSHFQFEMTKLEKKVSGISILLLLIAMIQQFLMIMYLQTTAEIVR